MDVSANIRECRAEDLRKLEWDGQFTAHRALFEEAWARKQRDEVEMLVADVDGEPVGQVWIDFTRRAPHKVGVFWALRVVERLQGIGLGRALVRAAERVLRAHGFEAAELAVQPSNLGAVRLYDRLGYRFFADESDTIRYREPSGVERVETSEHWLLRKRLADGRNNIGGSEGRATQQ